MARACLCALMEITRFEDAREGDEGEQGERVKENERASE